MCYVSVNFRLSLQNMVQSLIRVLSRREAVAECFKILWRGGFARASRGSMYGLLRRKKGAVTGPVKFKAALIPECKNYEARGILDRGH